MPGTRVCILTAAFASLALCQEFEVVSVKPNKSTPDDSSVTTDRGRLAATNVSLRGLIWRAYGVQDYQVEGPDWINSERFDISATLPEALPKGETFAAAFEVMMQKMLADRFKLIAHREQKVRPVYGLMVAKSGIKFKEAPAADCGSHSRNNSGTHFVGTCVSMEAFAAFLAKRGRDLPVDLPVLDMTGLQGFYNLKLDWIREIADSPSGVILPIALEEQLGLKLETRRAPIEILVVDSVLRTPSEN
jgi:uncharacterized protein (TIGR03435 family)